MPSDRSSALRVDADALRSLVEEKDPALQQDEAASAPFRHELERLEENGLSQPQLREWVWEAAAVLHRWVQGLLQAARAAAAAKGEDEYGEG